PGHWHMCAAIGDGGKEAVLLEQGDGIAHELGGAVHDAPPLVRMASTSERNEWCAWACAGTSATTGATSSTIGVGSTGRAICFRRGGGSGSGGGGNRSITRCGRGAGPISWCGGPVWAPTSEHEPQGSRAR